MEQQPQPLVYNQNFLNQKDMQQQRQELESLKYGTFNAQQQFDFLRSQLIQQPPAQEMGSPLDREPIQEKEDEDREEVNVFAAGSQEE